MRLKISNINHSIFFLFTTSFCMLEIHLLIASIVIIMFVSKTVFILLNAKLNVAIYFNLLSSCEC